MPVSYSFNGNILRMEVEGHYPPDAIIDAFEKALADPAFPPSNARLLLNVNRSESLAERSVEDLRRVVAHFARMADRVGRRCAIVAEADLLFGLMRMAEAFAAMHDTEVRVFKKEEEAVSWLAHSLRVATD